MMAETKKQRLAELRERLDELRKHDPSHCSGTGSFTGHSIPPELLQKIEETEDQIKAIEAETPDEG